MFKKRPNPEDPNLLKNLSPARRYTREEVALFLSMARGLVSDGLPCIGYSTILETDLWYQVEIDFGNDSYETWYFFKQYPDKE